MTPDEVDALVVPIEDGDEWPDNIRTKEGMKVCVQAHSLEPLDDAAAYEVGRIVRARFLDGDNMPNAERWRLELAEGIRAWREITKAPASR